MSPVPDHFFRIMTLPKKKIPYSWSDVKDLIPYANNARIHSESQIKQIAASIKEFGFINPVIIDDKNGIIAGHGRVLAAELLKIEKVPVIKVDHLSEQQKKAYILADNKLTLNSEWDMQMLSIELLDLKNNDFDINITGFSMPELKSIFGDSDGEGSSGDNSGEQKTEYLIVIECDNEEQQSKLYQELSDKGYKMRLMS